MKSIFIRTTIALVCSLLFATQVNAYDITTTVSPTGNAWEWGAGTRWLETISTSGETNKSSTGDAIFWGRGFSNSFLNGTWVLKSMVSGNNIEFKDGYYYKTQVSFNIVGYNVGTGNATAVGVQVPIVNRLVLPSNAPYKLVQISPYQLDCYEAASYSSSANLIVGGITGCYRGTVVYDIIVQATRTATGKLQLGDGASWFFQSFVGFNNTSGYGTLRPLTITEYKPDNASVINQEQTQAGQQAQQDGQNASNQAQQQTEQQTATAFQTIGNILGAITDTPPGDCSITGNMGHLDMGNLNLCQAEIEPIRPVIRAVLYLVMALATYKIMMWVLGSIAGLINWVQTGNEGKEENG